MLPARGAVTRHFFGSGGTRSAAAARNSLRNSRGQLSAARVLPVAIDHQGVVLAGFDGGADFGERGEAALDAAGVEEDREAALVAIPKFLVQFEEGVFDGHSVPQQVDVLPGIALAHGRGEVDVELERVGGQDSGGRIDLRDVCGGTSGAAAGMSKVDSTRGPSGGWKTARTCMPGDRGKRGRKTRDADSRL